MIYGVRNQASMIGDFLNDNDHHLQQPSDFDQSTTYYNPQYLVPPGSEFQASWQNTGFELTQSSQLNEKAKSQVSQIIDSASEPTVFSEVQVSHKIKTDLLEYASSPYLCFTICLFFHQTPEEGFSHDG